MIRSAGLMGAVPAGGMVVAPVAGVKKGIVGRFAGFTGEPVGVPGMGCTTGFPLMIEDG